MQQLRSCDRHQATLSKVYKEKPWPFPRQASFDLASTHHWTLTIFTTQIMEQQGLYAAFLFGFYLGSLHGDKPMRESTVVPFQPTNDLPKCPSSITNGAKSVDVLKQEMVISPEQAASQIEKPTATPDGFADTVEWQDNLSE